MFWWIAVAVLALLLLVGWLVDRRDRRDGHRVKDAKLLGERIKQARGQRRSEVFKSRADTDRRKSGFRPAGEKRQVKRGQ